MATKLVANNNQRVRSHFERLMPATQVENFRNECLAARQKLAEIEALAREAKKKEEMEEMARMHEASEQARLEGEAKEILGQQEADVEAMAMHNSSLPPPPAPFAGNTLTRRQQDADEEAMAMHNSSPPPPPAPFAVNAPKRRRMRGKQAPGDVDLQGEPQPDRDGETITGDAGHYTIRCMPREESNDPRARLEHELRRLADDLHDHPTVPAGCLDAVLDDNVAILLPPKHCAFRGCTWRLSWEETHKERPLHEYERERALVTHLLDTHRDQMQCSMDQMPQEHFKEADIAAAVYNEAIAIKVRGGTPLTSYSIDRRSLRKAAEATKGDNVQSLICFFCACTHPRVESFVNANIMWMQPLDCVQKDYLFGYSRGQTERLLSLDAYLRNYGKDTQGYFDLSRHLSEFEDWYIDVPFSDKTVRVLCCPEDHVCHASDCVATKRFCNRCWVPVCIKCHAHAMAAVPTLPPPALCNDMMVFYAPEEIYEDGGLTIMEMICASPCLTSMICFSMEVKYGNMFDSTLHMQRHRVGARGNATTFLLPWENVLLELQRLEDTNVARGVVPNLPRTGHELQYAVQVLLKTNDEDKREDLKHIIFQAQVNREKVVKCILGMKRRGHRAFYAHRRRSHEAKGFRITTARCAARADHAIS